MIQSPPSMNAEVESESNYYTDYENLAKKLFVHITLAKNPRGIYYWLSFVTIRMLLFGDRG